MSNRLRDMETIDSRRLHWNEIDSHRTAVWKIVCSLQDPGTIHQHAMSAMNVNMLHQLPLPQPRSNIAFVSPGISSTMISCTGGGYCPAIIFSISCCTSTKILSEDIRFAAEERTKSLHFFLVRRKTIYFGIGIDTPSMLVCNRICS